MMTASLRSTVLIPVALAASLGLAGCARQISGDVYEGRAAGQVARTQVGWIESARLVHIQEKDQLQQNALGVAIGGGTGGVIGAQVGRTWGWGRVLATGAGALAGATIGAAIEQDFKRRPAMEYVVRTDSGELFTIVQGIEPRLVPGQRVYLQQAQRGRGRVVPAG